MIRAQWLCMDKSLDWCPGNTQHIITVLVGTSSIMCCINSIVCCIYLKLIMIAIIPSHSHTITPSHHIYRSWFQYTSCWGCWTETRHATMPGVVPSANRRWGPTSFAKSRLCRAPPHPNVRQPPQPSPAESPQPWYVCLSTSLSQRRSDTVDLCSLGR